MSEGRRLVLWRHGRTAWNVAQRFQGQTDVPLDDVGARQATRAARVLAATRPDVIVSSDLARASSTAMRLGRVTGTEVTYDEGLRERHGGLWQGRTLKEFLAAHPGQPSWRTPGGDVRPPAGETLAEAGARAVDTLAKTLAPLPDGATVVAVTHGATARGVLCALLGLDVARAGVLGPLANCAWSVLEESPGGWCLLAHNVGAVNGGPARDDTPRWAEAPGTT
ncbi:MAG: histidine phosphatase family protein [Actinomycetes bacterium]